MKERHLRLVVPYCQKKRKDCIFFTYKKKIKDFLDNTFTSREEKIYMIKDFLIKLYRDYEISTGIVNPPYFIRAENRIIRIVKERKVDYYYSLYKKYKYYNF